MSDAHLHQLPPAFARFVELFNAGEFWESHEVLEGPWRTGRSGFYHGMILLASAHVHVQRGNPRGVAAQMRKAIRALEPFRPRWMGMDVDALLAHARSAIAAAEASGDAESLRRAVPAPRLAPHPALVRGDEPELRG